MTEKKNKATFDTLDDTRKDDNGKVVDTYRHRTPSGHLIEYSDVNGKEHITISHRGGSLFQMQPDGSVRLSSANGKMGIEVNGEGYMTVTGLYNLVVNGDAGIRIDGDADWHVGGDMKMTVDGTYSIAAKNMTTKIAEKYELTAQNMAFHAADNGVFTSGNKMALWSSGDALVKSSATMTLIGSTRVDINPT